MTQEKNAAIVGYMETEKPYDVCFRTCLGGYAEFAKIERGIMFEDTAREIAESYAETARQRQSEYFVSVCVMKHCEIIYEITL